MTDTDDSGLRNHAELSIEMKKNKMNSEKFTGNGCPLLKNHAELSIEGKKNKKKKKNSEKSTGNECPLLMNDTDDSALRNNADPTTLEVGILYSETTQNTRGTKVTGSCSSVGNMPESTYKSKKNVEAQNLDPKKINSIEDASIGKHESKKSLCVYTRKMKSKGSASPDVAPRSCDAQIIPCKTKCKRTEQVEKGTGPPNLKPCNENSWSPSKQIEQRHYVRPITRKKMHKSTKEEEKDSVLPNFKPREGHDLSPSLQVDQLHDAQPDTYKEKRKRTKLKEKVSILENCVCAVPLDKCSDGDINSNDAHQKMKTQLHDLDVVAAQSKANGKAMSLRSPCMPNKGCTLENAMISDVAGTFDYKEKVGGSASSTSNVIDNVALICLSNKHGSLLDVSKREIVSLTSHAVSLTSMNKPSDDPKRVSGPSSEDEEKKPEPYIGKGSGLKDTQIYTPCSEGADSSMDMTRDGASVASKETIPVEKPFTSARKKLLVLDLNGLLADVVYVSQYTHRVHRRVGGKSVFKRPFCDEFLKFCFKAFDIGVWSSRRRYNVDAVVDFLMGHRKHDLLFCWDQSKCTDTGFTTVGNVHKPLVLKELKKLWNKEEPGLRWENGEYSRSNTLLIDDSPYKALCNPPHTAIFPSPYSYLNENDDSLGPGGDLRVYLERLAMADDVQLYVQKNPFGQHAITESNPSWHFYVKIIEKFKNFLPQAVEI